MTIPIFFQMDILAFLFKNWSSPQVGNQNTPAPPCKYTGRHRTYRFTPGCVTAESRQVKASGRPTPTTLREAYISPNEVAVKVELQMWGGQVGQHKSTVCFVRTCIRVCKKAAFLLHFSCHICFNLADARLRSLLAGAGQPGPSLMEAPPSPSHSLAVLLGLLYTSNPTADDWLLLKKVI